MKAALRYAVFGLAMYAAFLLATVPAPWVYSRWVQPRLGSWTLYGVQGTVWRGRATLLKSGDVELENLHWTLHPWALLWGRAEAALRFDYGAAPGGMVLARGLNGNWYFKDIVVDLPAARLSPLLRLPGAELGGKLAVRLSSFTVQRGRATAARGSVSWEQAALRKPVAVELGAFAVSVDSDAAGISGALLDRGGAVQAQGVFKLSPDGQYQLTATFASRNPGQPLIGQGLLLFGTPGPDGRVKYSAAGAVPAILAGAGS